jgi:uncharacterized membrane protein
MKLNRPAGNNSSLETAISYLLIIGVVLSVLLEIAGIIMLYHTSGSLAVLQDKSVFVQEHDFFQFIYKSFGTGNSNGTGIWLMTAGLVILILTPFLRVILSVFYFAWKKDFKYMIITAFVLLVLTISLILH